MVEYYLEEAEEENGSYMVQCQMCVTHMDGLFVILFTEVSNSKLRQSSNWENRQIGLVFFFSLPLHGKSTASEPMKKKKKEKEEPNAIKASLHHIYLSIAHVFDSNSSV